jgi:hypothetical protein
VGVGVPGGLLGHDGLDRGDADRVGGRGDGEGRGAGEEEGAGGGSHGSWIWLGVGEDKVDEAVREEGDDRPGDDGCGGG